MVKQLNHDTIDDLKWELAAKDEEIKKLKAEVAQLNNVIELSKEVNSPASNKDQSFNSHLNRISHTGDLGYVDGREVYVVEHDRLGKMLEVECQETFGLFFAKEAEFTPKSSIQLFASFPKRK